MLDFKIKNIKETYAKIEAIKAQGQKAIDATVKDMKSRAPTQVAKAVTQVYNISASELKPPNTRVKTDKWGQKRTIRKAADIKIDGDSIESLRLVYYSRLLTPHRFKMQPQAPVYKLLNAADRYVVHTKNPKERYFTAEVYNDTPKITAKVKKKGGRKALREYKETKRIFLGKANAKQTGTSNTVIPYMYDENSPYKVVPIKRLSVSQMIWDKQVASDIRKRLEELLNKRFEHQSKRFDLR